MIFIYISKYTLKQHLIATTVFNHDHWKESSNITLGYKPVSTKELSQFSSLPLSLWVKQPV